MSRTAVTAPPELSIRIVSVPAPKVRMSASAKPVVVANDTMSSPEPVVMVSVLPVEAVASIVKPVVYALAAIV